MAESNTNVCEPCEHEGNYKAASSWCHDCEAGYCVHCVDSHRRFKITRDHHLIPISDYAKASDLSISLICKEHDQKFDSFCPQHDTVLCRRCLQISHNSCNEIVDLEKAVLGVKESVAVSELVDCLTNALKNIGRGLSSQTENRNGLDTESEGIKQSIMEQYTQLCHHLDKLKDQCLNEVDHKCRTSKSQIEVTEKRLKDQHEKISAFKDNIETAKLVASDLQTFILIKDIAKKANSEIEQLKEELKRTPKCNITMKLNASLLSFVNSVGTFGEVVLDKSIDSIAYKSKGYQEQIQMVGCRNVVDIALELNKTFPLQQSRKEIDLDSCLVLPDRHMIFTDHYNKSLLIYNGDGYLNKEIQLGKIPRYITAIESSNIIVSYGACASEIEIVNVKTEQVKIFSSVSLKGHAMGVSYNMGMVYVVDSEIGILVIDCDGKLTKTLPINKNNLTKLAVCRDKVYCNALYEKVVFCFDMDGQIVWKFDIAHLQTSDQFTNPITVDGDGNVYVIGKETCTIMVISPDGKQSKLLVDKKHCKKPRGLFYHEQPDTLVTYCEENNRVLVFEVK